ncbi:hypothetical protein ACFY1P_19610 [Streptomyces sp. NPDC001407]|uniref:hypothetical protein n=1 Tax=Streptomyces sp. NPDC001407 TaxID=3364573 RepID=UPI0036C56CFC
MVDDDGATSPASPGKTAQRRSAPPVAPAAPTAPADSPEPTEEPAKDADQDDDEGTSPAEATTARPKVRREPRASKPKHHGEDGKDDQPQNKPEKRGGMLSKDTVGRALDKLMPGTEDMIEKVPDWAWPFRSFLVTMAEPGTPVQLEVTATDPATDTVTVTATLTTADGPSESAPLEVAVTVTPPAPKTPNEPATVAVEVTNTATGESVTTEQKTTVEAVTVVATVTTVATVSDVLRDDYAPAA